MKIDLRPRLGPIQVEKLVNDSLIATGTIEDGNKKNACIHEQEIL